ncbi:MAG: TerB family tellurite resistance protein [Pseudomonadota bacterium]
MRILDSIGELLNRKSSVQMVADNPQTSAEILLLIRTMFADGEMQPEELEMFKRLCQSLFNIPPEDVPEVIRYLREVSYETNHEQAAGIFDETPVERKQELMTHLVMMAMADSRVHEQEKEILKRVASVLGYTSEQIDSMF